jgi:acetoin utilization protein AcuC
MIVFFIGARSSPPLQNSGLSLNNNMMQPRFIGGEIYRLNVFSAPHPLAIGRAMLAADLCRALGWLESSQYQDSPRADPAELCRFHDPFYIAALQRAEVEQDLPADLRQQTRIGADANPIHAAVFRRPATSAGGGLLAAGLTGAGGVVHAPGVGNHHGQPNRASGFCYVNDIALTLLRWRDFGLRRIAYLDLDAHHGDGVETAFAADPDILTISIHEAGRWPRTGLASQPAAGVWNFPVPPGFNDSEFSILLHDAILPLLTAFAPEAIFLLPGADALADDPMAKLELSNNAIWDAVAAIRPLYPRLIVGGGGGYNPFALARCWAGIWATLNGIPIPATLPPAAQALLREQTYARAAGRNPPDRWFTTLRDAPNSGPVRDEIRRMIP